MLPESKGAESGNVDENELEKNNAGVLCSGNYFAKAQRLFYVNSTY